MFEASQHLDPNDIASYVDRALDDRARERVEAHLSQCDSCRDEVAAVSDLASGLKRSASPKRLWIAAVAAAGILIVLLPRHRQPAETGHREPAVTTAISPRALAPVGRVDSLRRIVWSSVPGADTYHVFVYDSLGTVLWDREIADTSVAPKDIIGLQSGVPYYWRVEANTGVSRASHSELAGFELRSTPR